MVKFDPNKLTIEVIRLKAVSQALGGSISVIDEKLTSKTKEVMNRRHVPLSVARAFIQKTKKVTKYLKPTYTALATYEGHVVCMERHPLASMGALVEDGRRWTPISESLLKSKVLPTIRSTSYQWYFDGRYVYNFGCSEANLLATISNSKAMTADGLFRKVKAYAIDLQALDVKDGLDVTERHCIAFVSREKQGVFTITPPIWKNVSNVGMTKLKGGGDDDEDDNEVEEDQGGDEVELNFDKIDQRLAVNLNFALRAGVEVGKTFGYEYIEPLHLARLMIELRTVNLPNLSKAVKGTYDINLKFTHALGWLMGLQRRATNLETMLMVRSLMKYLTKKGLFISDAFQAENIFQPGKTFDDLTMIKASDLLDRKDKIKAVEQSIDAALFEKGAKRRRTAEAQGATSIAGMMNEEGD